MGEHEADNEPGLCDREPSSQKRSGGGVDVYGRVVGKKEIAMSKSQSVLKV